MLSSDVTIFSGVGWGGGGGGVSVVIFIYFKCCSTSSKDSLAPTYIHVYNKTGVYKGINYSSYICSKTEILGTR